MIFDLYTICRCQLSRFSLPIGTLILLFSVKASSAVISNECICKSCHRGGLVVEHNCSVKHVNFTDILLVNKTWYIYIINGYHN